MDPKVIEEENLDFDNITGYLNVKWLIDSPKEYNMIYYGIKSKINGEPNKMVEELLENYFSMK